MPGRQGRRVRRPSGILPGDDRAAANEYVDVAIAPGWGEGRNALVVRAADAVIAIEGGYGTLSEIALALKAGKRVVGLGTWDIEGVEAVDSPAGPSRPFSRPQHLDSPPMAGQSDTPYLDALRAYAARDPGRFHVPGHKGGPGADPGLVEAFGERALALDIPALMYGHRRGRGAHAVRAGGAPGGRGVGRAAHLVARERRLAGQPRCAADAGPQRAPRGDPAERALEHDRRADHVGAAAHLRVAGARPGAPHRALHDAGRARARARDTPDAAGATIVSPTYFGAVADVAGLAEVAHAHGVPLVVDEAWGAHLAFHEELPTPRSRSGPTS